MSLWRGKSVGTILRRVHDKDDGYGIRYQLISALHIKEIPESLRLSECYRKHIEREAISRESYVRGWKKSSIFETTAVTQKIGIYL
jgi:hypothetical protein